MESVRRIGSGPTEVNGLAGRIEKDGVGARGAVKKVRRLNLIGVGDGEGVVTRGLSDVVDGSCGSIIAHGDVDRGRISSSQVSAASVAIIVRRHGERGGRGRDTAIVEVAQRAGARGA